MHEVTTEIQKLVYEFPPKLASKRKDFSGINFSQQAKCTGVQKSNPLVATYETVTCDLQWFVELTGLNRSFGVWFVGGEK